MIFYLLNNSEKKVFCSSYPPLPDILYLTKQKQVQQICIRKNKCQVLASFPSKFRMSPVLNILEKVQCQQQGIDQFLFLICRHNCSCNCFSLFYCSQRLNSGCCLMAGSELWITLALANFPFINIFKPGVFIWVKVI